MSSDSTAGNVIPPGAAFVASADGREYYWVGSADWYDIPPLDRIWFPTAEAAKEAGYTEAADSFERLEEFELLEEVGRGGTSIVYRAEDRSLGREVAIKVVQACYQEDPENIERFAREARLLASLRHPNIVSAFSVKQLRSGGLALVMEYVRGPTLREVLRTGGACSIEQTERVLRDLAGALATAHRAGIVHRDVKPDNVFIEQSTKRTLLADFGIATHLDSPSGLTMVGTAVGTPNYMSPEQIDGRSLDGRSDIYSLGLIGWEMLAGVKPWGAESLYSVIYKQKHEDLPSLRGIRSDVPLRLVVAIETALAKEPTDRWGDADELLGCLNDRTLATRIRRWSALGGQRSLRGTLGEPHAESPQGTEEARTIRFERGPDTEAAPQSLEEGGPSIMIPAQWRRSTAVAVLVSFLTLLAFGLRPPIAALDLTLAEAAFVESGFDARMPAGTSASEMPARQLASAPRPSGIDPNVSAATEMEHALEELPEVTPETPEPTEMDEPAPETAAAAETVEDVAPPAPAPVLGVAASASRVAAGGMHTCRVEGDGTLVCWGGNDAGQLGASGGSRGTPVTLTNVGAVRAIEAGAFHSCALSPEGTAVCWGENRDGQLGDRGGGGGPAAIAGGRFHSLTLGSAHTCGVGTDGFGYCWGSNAFGQLGDGTRATRSSARRIAGTEELALIAAGWNHTCALDRQGQAFCWGRNQGGQLGDGSTTDRPSAVRVRGDVRFRTTAAGSAHTCALALTGQAYCWGENTDGRLGDGTIGSRLIPTPVAGNLRFAEISAGSRHTCALTNAGVAYCWGYNNYGQLGIGDLNIRSVPTRVQTDLVFTSIRSTGAHTCGTAGDGATYCWGYNVEGQIGDGSTTHRTVPHRVGGPGSTG